MLSSLSDTFVGDSAEGRTAHCPALPRSQEAKGCCRGRDQNLGDNHIERLLPETANVVLQTHTHKHTHSAHPLCLCPSLCPAPRLSQARGLFVPRGYRGHAGRQPTRQNRQSELGQNPTQGRWRRQVTQQRERGLWSQVFRQGKAYLAYGKTECGMKKWMMEKELNNETLPCCLQL